MQYLAEASSFFKLVGKQQRTKSIALLYRSLLKNSTKLRRYDKVTALMIRAEIKLRFMRGKNFRDTKDVLLSYEEGLKYDSIISKAVDKQHVASLEKLDALSYGQTGPNKILFAEALASQNQKSFEAVQNIQPYDIPLPQEFKSYLEKGPRKYKLRKLSEPNLPFESQTLLGEGQEVKELKKFYKLKTQLRY